MSYHAVIVTWMDDRQETYRADGLVNVHEDEIVFLAAGLPLKTIRIPLSNVRVWVVE